MPVPSKRRLIGVHLILASSDIDHAQLVGISFLRLLLSNHCPFGLPAKPVEIHQDYYEYPSIILRFIRVHCSLIAIPIAYLPYGYRQSLPDKLKPSTVRQRCDGEFGRKAGLLGPCPWLLSRNRGLRMFLLQAARQKLPQHPSQTATIHSRPATSDDFSMLIHGILAQRRHVGTSLTPSEARQQRIFLSVQDCAIDWMAVRRPGMPANLRPQCTPSGHGGMQPEVSATGDRSLPHLAVSLEAGGC